MGDVFASRNPATEDPEEYGPDVNLFVFDRKNINWPAAARHTVRFFGRPRRLWLLPFTVAFLTLTCLGRALSLGNASRSSRDFRQHESHVSQPSPHAYHPQIGRAHVCTPVTNAHLVCRLLLEQKNTQLK